MKKGLSGISKSNKITRREFVLILLLLLILEGYLLVNYLLIPKWNEYQDLKSRIETQEDNLKRLEAEYSKKAEYEQKLKTLEAELDEKSKRLPPYSSQEDVILTIDRFSRQSGVAFDVLSFGEASVTGANDFAKQAAAKEANTQAAESPQGSRDAKIIYQDINVGFSGTYTSLYSFLNLLENNDTKVAVTELSLQRMTHNFLRGSMGFKYIGYLQPGDDRVYELEIPEIEGRSDPFIPYSGYTEGITGVSGNADEKQTDPDFLMIINSYLDNAPKIILGRFPAGDSEVYFNSNNGTKGRLALEGKSGSYSYTYTLGGSTKSGNISLAGGKETIALEILSRARRTANDSVSVTFDIENKTDKALELAVKNDDGQKPRFVTGNISGEVIIK